MIFSTFLSIALLSVTALAQNQDCSQTNYEPCKSAIEIFKTNTCEPIMSKNATLYQSCICYYDVHYG
jgi:hypothetical protein